MMPPSPALRCSPGREHRVEITHKRGRSLESGLPLKAQDDDLALFKDMGNSERDDFLLRTADDFDDSIAKLRYFPDYKLAINIPIRGESSDLLNADGDKNDYDWLLTPPDTPLFPSLDDDEPQTINLASRGRARSQPIAISRSSMAERTNRTSRSSASPHRLSPSPRSSSSLIQSRGRSSPAPQSSPPTVQRPATPSRRASTPPSKPTPPTPRSTTPTLRRMSSGSSGQPSSSGRRGASPINTSRGNSSSPKLQGWQSNLPGFSSDVPPNLRTSLSDRPASYTRGSSPASRNGHDSSSKFGRQSISPTASRSASSSHSHERDRFSSYSRGSAASSGDDDVDSLHSATVGISGSSVARKNGLVVNNRVTAFSKRPSRTLYASSAPKRSFDSALRPMDHHKSPQNMFRPLLSSVPSTTFYAGKTNSTHRPMFSRNSSLTTSSNASSEQGASIVPDTEGIGDDQNDLAAEWEKPQCPETQEEMFIFDKVDENIESETFDVGLSDKVDSDGLKKSGGNFGQTSVGNASESSCAVGNNSEVDICMMSVCSSCGNHFRIIYVDGVSDVCKDCAEKAVLIATGESGVSLLVTQNCILQSEIATGIDRLSKEDQLKIGVGCVAELAEKSSIAVMLRQSERDLEQGPCCLPGSFSPQSMMDETNQHLADQQLNAQQEASSKKSDGDIKFQQFQYTTHPSLRIDNPEGTGISVLLQRSDSSKWPIVQGRVFSATSILCSEPSYIRDNTSAMKRSISRDSGSVSSSIDLGSSRQLEPRVQRQLSSKRGEMDNVRNNCYEKVHSFELHSAVPLSASEALFLADSKEGEIFDSFSKGVGYGVSEDSTVVSKDYERSLEDQELCAMPSSCRQEAVADGVQVLHASDGMETNTFDSPLLSHPESVLIEASAADFPNEDCSSSVKSEKDAQNGEQKFQDKEVRMDITDSSKEDDMSNGTARPVDISNAVIDCSSLLEQDTDHNGAQGSCTDCTPSLDANNTPNSHDCSISTTSEMETSNPALECSTISHAGDVYEDLTVKFEDRHMSRSVTLEEATDTILFCSSIIHDLAYKAATIGMEKELAPPEALRPTVTILGKSVLDQQDSRTPHKRTPKSQKSKKKRLEADSNVPVLQSGGHVIVHEYKPATPELPSKMDSIKPPKLESKCNCTVM